MIYPGRHYRRVYGYPLHWAVLAELAWRLEHIGIIRIETKGYRWRKHFERRGMLNAR